MFIYNLNNTMLLSKKLIVYISNRHLTSVNHNLIFVANLLVNKELSDVCSLVSRQLQNLSKLRIHQYASVALESLLQSFGDLQNVQIVGKSLNGGNAFTTISLLHTNMYLGSILSGVVRERVYKGGEILRKYLASKQNSRDLLKSSKIIFSSSRQL